MWPKRAQMLRDLAATLPTLRTGMPSSLPVAIPTFLQQEVHHAVRVYFESFVGPRVGGRVAVRCPGRSVHLSGWPVGSVGRIRLQKFGKQRHHILSVSIAR